MAEQITFDVLARDRASATFNQIGRSTEALETRFARLTRAATGIASTLVGAEIGRSVLEAADKFELSRSRLETITKNIGQNFDGLSKQVSEADDRMAKFGFTSAEAEGSLADLESVTRDPVKAFKDLALAADIARGRNIGLSEATLILQRVETGHVAQLAKLGIATKDAAGHALTQAQALQMLTTLYGGAATRYAGTFAGQQAAVAASMKNSAAEIGVALLPAAVELAHVLQQDVLPPIISLAHWLDENRGTIEPLAKSVLIAVGAWKAYGLWTKAAGEASALFGTRAMGAAERVAAASAIQAAATRKAAAAVLPDLRAMTIAEDTAGRAARNRILAVAGGALGAGALIASSQTSGTASKVLGAAGTGALVGSAAGPVGAAVGAGTGAAVALLSSRGSGVNPRYAFGTYAHAANQATDATKELAFASKALTGAETTLGAAANRTAAQIEASAQKALGLRSAQDALRSAMHAAAQTAADNGKALRGNSDAALANRDAVRGEVTQIFAVIDAMKARHASDAAQANMLDILTQAVETNAIKTYGDKAAVDALLTSLGLIPGKALAAANALTAINDAVAADKAISPDMVKAATASSAAATEAGKKIADSFTTGFSPVVSKAAEKSAKAAAKAVSDAMQQARDKVTNDLQTIRDAINSTQSSIAGFADFTAAGTDSLGAAGVNTNVAGQLKAKAARLEQFARLFNQLDRAGLDAHLMAQFAQIGPDAIPAMQALQHGGKRGIAQVNRIEQRIQTAAGSVAQTETRELYSRQIHDDLLKLPPKLSRVLSKDLRNVHFTVSVREVDRRNGIAVVTAP